MTRHHFRDNDYDSCLLVGDLNCFYVLLKRLVMLHAQELRIIRHQAKQTPINPGGRDRHSTFVSLTNVLYRGHHYGPDYPLALYQLACGGES